MADRCRALAVLVLLAAVPAAQAQSVVVGSKKFTENVILAEMGRLLIEHEGLPAEHRAELGGTRFLWEALRAGDIDAYPDYTGTIREEILAGEPLGSGGLAAALAAYSVRVTEPLGFDNTYALGMRADRAEALGIRRISDLRDHPGLRLGFSNEFMDRADGWPGLRDAYALPQPDVRGLDHDLSYRGLESGTLDVTDLYSTDAEIEQYGIRVLEDDRAYFPDYQAVFLYRDDLPPEAAAALGALAGRIPDDAMIRLNARVLLERVPEARVAADFLTARLRPGLRADVREETVWDRLGRHTAEHLALVLISLLAAIAVAIPLGVLAATVRAVEQPILGTVGVIYTIPSLALLVFMIPLLGIGGPPAVVALFLYSLLPIVRNTHAGLKDIPAPLRESAEALGLPPRTRLLRVELPLAARSILAGIQTSAVINVGTATLGALIGAGGYGQPILTGIRLNDTGLILEGAVPAALLALAAQGFFGLVERLAVPEGLRYEAA
ncbi:MAG: glycine betaine ABC transporter substrate-binding protein [Rhodothermales bacterium]|nr:glycine betaine ABC transporter substrate-binding protein [Rhodothermales bacterium]